MAQMRRALVLACLVAGCNSGAAPDIVGLSDQVAVVGTEFVLELEGTDADGDNLTYGVHADVPLDGVATVSQTPAGNGLFRWTPAASDVGQRAFDFTVSDGDHTTTVSIGIDVRATAAGIPVFRQPLGTGRVVNLSTDPCMDIDIVIEDEDTAQVTIVEEPPTITGATLNVTGGLTATWHWCPTAAQVADSNRYTLMLSADDGEHRTTKEFVIVLGAGPAGASLVINEIDYDNIGTDSLEMVELLNSTSGSLSLAGMKVALVNGATNMTYQTIDLGSVGSLDAGQYLVLTSASTLGVSTTAKRIDPQWTQDQIQNGPMDGLAVFDSVTLTVLDALAYEGPVTAAMLPGFTAPVSLVEGTALPATNEDSNDTIRTICRFPNGVDTNDAATDWTMCGTLTRGKANVK
jgi:hypothetical protein